MIPKTIFDNISNFEFYPERQKICGRMWSGSAISIVDDIKFNLQLWYHGDYKETEESLIKRLALKSMVHPTLPFDLYWSAVWDENQLWSHPVGWFSDRELEKQIPRANPNFDSRLFEEKKMVSLGFVRVI